MRKWTGIIIVILGMILLVSPISKLLNFNELSVAQSGVSDGESWQVNYSLVDNEKDYWHLTIYPQRIGQKAPKKVIFIKNGTRQVIEKEQLKYYKETKDEAEYYEVTVNFTAPKKGDTYEIEIVDANNQKEMITLK